MAEIRLRRDSISQRLRWQLSALDNPTPVLKAMGLAVVAITKRAFKDASLRPAPWARLKKGGPATLRKTGALWQSIRMVRTDKRAAYVGSDRPYSMAHQFGYASRGLPARPYFPFTPGKRLTPVARKRVEAVVKAKIEAILRKK